MGTQEICSVSQALAGKNYRLILKCHRCKELVEMDRNENITVATRLHCCSPDMYGTLEVVGFHVTDDHEQ